MDPYAAEKNTKKKKKKKGADGSTSEAEGDGLSPVDRAEAAVGAK